MLPQEVHEERKAALIKATVNAVVEDGVERLTTKSIGELSGVREVYIYRYFANKEDLLAKTFSLADEALLSLILDNFTVMSFDGMDYELRCRVLFQKCWDYILRYPDWLIFYIRYYYSQSFQRYSYSGHMKRYEQLAERIKPACRSATEAEAVLQHILDTLLGQARKQIMHPSEPSAAADSAFRLIYSVIKDGKSL